MWTRPFGMGRLMKDESIYERKQPTRRIREEEIDFLSGRAMEFVYCRCFQRHMAKDPLQFWRRAFTRLVMFDNLHACATLRAMLQHPQQGLFSCS